MDQLNLNRRNKGSKSYQRGDTLLYLLIIVSLFTLMMLPTINMLVLESRVISTTVDREEALQIAEAGINYYQWHLAHFPSDFKDGTSSSGPYVHSYSDYDTEKTVGSFSLVITPPTTGSTIVTIKSTGSPSDNPKITRTITATFGIPSLAQYSFLSNDVVWIGTNEIVEGQLQSNNGVRFDGTGNAPIMSAKSTYTCPSGQGSPCPATENGVWGGAPQTVQNFWEFPVPAVDFSTLTSNLASIKSDAQSAGLYLSGSGAQGYSIVFNSNGTMSIYKVTSLLSNETGWDVAGNSHPEGTDYNVRTPLSGYQNVALPGNGIIYVQDNVWVEGTVKGRVMIASAILPYNSNTAPTIYVPNNITYAAKDGSCVLGLLSQTDVVVTYNAPTNLEIDAALISQNGSDQFYYYPNNIKNGITVFGSIMTYGQWTWSWVDGGNNVVSGYTNTTDIYDNNLLYGPPPDFPFSTSGYQQLTWTSN